MLLDLLKEKQTTLRLSDTQFAARLGISYDLWRSIRLGRRQIREIVLRGVMAEFPEFREAVLLYLASTGTNVPENGTIANTPDLCEVAGG